LQSSAKRRFFSPRVCLSPRLCRQLEITDATYYRWRKEFGGLRVDQAKRLKEIELENTRLRKVIADLTIDNAILKEAARGNF